MSTVPTASAMPKSTGASGIGITFATVVGPVQAGLGFKLNPSALDVRDPAAVARALLNDRPFESVPEDFIRRPHLHLSVGRLS